jgi:hypothetical protein
MTTAAFEIKNIKVIFEPINLVGYTHRVVVVRDGYCIAKDWLGTEYNANKKAAEYYFSKHCLKVDNQALLRKAVKKETKPQVSSKKAFAQWLISHDFEVVGMVGTYTTPIDVYVKVMKEADKWNKGSFLYNNVYHNCPRWMRRFRNYCEILYKKDVIGVEVLTILNSKEWDSKQFDD